MVNENCEYRSHGIYPMTFPFGVKQQLHNILFTPVGIFVDPPSVIFYSNSGTETKTF